MSEALDRTDELEPEQRDALQEIVGQVMAGDVDRDEAIRLAGDAGIDADVLTAAVLAASRAAGGLDGLDVTDGEAVQAFDVEAFVKMLPPGVALCPHCIGMGWVVEDPPFDPTTSSCPVCRGHGRVRTGSLKTGADAERDCVRCNGRGWVENDPGVLLHPATAADVVDVDVQPVDAEGRTPDDPDFDWTRIVERAPAPPAAEPEPATA